MTYKAMTPKVWGMPNKDGDILDVISPEEHDLLEGGYTVPLYTFNQVVEQRQSIEQAQKQEPVAWRGYNWGHSPDDWVYRDFDDPILDGNGNNVGQPLYTSPPQRQSVDNESDNG